jgi:hypothetical protein
VKELPRRPTHEGAALPNPGASPRNVAIVGKGSDYDGVPWGQEGWEIWGLNDWWAGQPDIELHTRWFQLHPPHYLKKFYPRGIRDLRELWGKKRSVRLYMDRHYARYPDSEPYPKADVESLTPHGRYHASSFDWMVALAIREGFQHIALHNVHFFTAATLNGEPLSGRPCLEYWCGVAEGRGIRVTLHNDREEELFRIVHLAHRVSDFQYGFGPEPALQLGNGWRDLR